MNRGLPENNIVTRLLHDMQEGENDAADRLLEAVYDELRVLAADRLRREKPGQTLQATALVHEAYLRLLGNDASGWKGRAHFFGALSALEQFDVEKAVLVKLRHFAGLSEEQAARVLGISRATAARHWAYARAWLYTEILRLQGLR